MAFVHSILYGAARVLLSESIELPDSASPRTNSPERLFAGPGEVRAIGRQFDWAGTPLGPVARWPQSLRSTVRTLLSSQYPMVLTWGPAFTQIYNDAYSKLIGDRHPAGLGGDIRVTLAEAWDILGPMIERVMATREANWTPALPLEMHRAGYREEAYFSVSHAPAEDDEGEVVGMLAVCSEVTEQIVSERRLRLLREIASKAGDATETADAARDLIANLSEHPLDVPYGLLYLREGDALTLAASHGLPDPSRLDAMQFPLSPDQDLWELETVFSGTSTVAAGVHERVPAFGGAYGDPVTHAISLPVLGSQGEVTGALVCGVSPNRALDEGYRSFFELLAGQVSVAIRNVRAREDERRRTQELAELDRAKTAFFSNVSHEFRTPLTLILGPLEDAMREETDCLPAHREGLEMARRNALRLLRLVNTLLDFSRVEASRIAAKLEPVDLAALTADLASNFRAAIEKTGLRLVVDTPPLPRPVAVDRDMYEKIVLNLLSNAFKFTHEGEIRVQLAPAEDAAAAVLTVSDTGAGIVAEELDKVFVRFHRIEGQRARSHEGSGIGLALVKQLVELQGGTIEVTSGGEGLGSTFRIVLPLCEEGVEPAVGPAREPSQRSAAYVQEALRWLPDEAAMPEQPAAGSRPHILLADDNADMRAYVRRLLAPEYEVTVVPDGHQALIAARTNPPDLVLSDIMMPELDGFGLLHALRADPATAVTPVIFLSARAGEEARIESLEAGADDHLVKPFSALELRARVAGALDLAELRGEKAARERVLEATQETTQARAALKQSERQLQSLADALPVLISHVDADLRYRFVNRAYEDWLNRPIDEIIGASVEEMVGSEAFALVKPKLEAALQGQDLQFETFMPYSNIRPRHVRVNYVPQRGTDGTVEGFYGLVQDITERKEAERHRELLVDELNHRVKNTLAVVQSIAAQSFKGDHEPARARASFEGRLLALSNAHNLLTQESWDFAMLRDVIATSTHAFGGEARISPVGPDLAVTPKAAVSIALALHELCTNAAKYGALSTPEGTVTIAWSVDPAAEDGAATFRLTWDESGGPPVHPPLRRGFGSRLVERGLAAELGGTAELMFAPAGLRCTIAAPFANIGGARCL